MSGCRDEPLCAGENGDGVPVKRKQKPLFDCDSGPFVDRIRITIPRRALFSVMSDELRVCNQAADGKPVYEIEDTAEMQPEEFALLKPVLSRGAKISLSDGFVWGLPHNGLETLLLFQTNSPALAIFNCFNGKTTIAEITEMTMQSTGWPEEKAAAVVRGLFLKLCEVRICQPG